MFTEIIDLVKRGLSAAVALFEAAATLISSNSILLIGTIIALFSFGKSLKIGKLFSFKG